MSQLAITERLSALPAETGVRLALKLDAVVTGANGAAYLAAASLLDGPLGMPASFLRGIGAFLLVFAAAVWIAAGTGTVRRPPVIGVIAVNALWVIESLTLVVFGWHDPTTGGAAWVVLQAVVVGAFAALQGAALRRVVRM